MEFSDLLAQTRWLNVVRNSIANIANGVANQLRFCVNKPRAVPEMIGRLGLLD
jgi:hypothetical protein